MECSGDLSCHRLVPQGDGVHYRDGGRSLYDPFRRPGRR